MNEIKTLIDKLNRERNLSIEEFEFIFSNYSKDDVSYAAGAAKKIRDEIFGCWVYIRGLIEFSNVCRNDCYYCGIRRSNSEAERYTLAEDEILSCCENGYILGFRTFVLQSGEGCVSPDVICGIVEKIKNKYPECAVTLSLGEMRREDYLSFYNAGADRYLLRHETADRDHYEKLHPAGMSFDNRMRCLYDLKEIGFQTGCGFMVGSPYQTKKTLAKDFAFIKEFSPHMVGIGPFIPHKDTPFSEEKEGDVELTLFLLSLLRIMSPYLLLPATTALGTLDPMGREKGILAGANVVMPNLSPCGVRKKYLLYDNKICTGDESAECVNCMGMRLANIGYKISVSRGDYLEKTIKEK